MERKNFIRIINEEIAQFDFLNNEKHLKEQETVGLLHNESFQKKFIIDSILYMKEKIYFDHSDTIVRNNPDVQFSDNHDDLNIDMFSDIIYKYNDDSIKFSISFDGTNIGYNTDYSSEEATNYFDSWYTSVDWYSIEVNLFTPEGDDVEFVAFKNAPEKIQELFIRSYVEPIIEKYTDVGDVREKMPTYSSF